MAKLPGGLGRGLDSLLSGSIEDGQGDRLAVAAVGDIRPGRYQPRVQMDDEALHELAESIRAQGVIQPVIVREHGLSQYELIAGERRWRAAQLAGLAEIPIVVKNISDETALAMGLIENLQRENLNPIEEARGLKRLADEFSLTHETIAKAVGKSRSAVSNSLRLLALPEPVQDMLYRRHLEMGHGPRPADPAGGRPAGIGAKSGEKRLVGAGSGKTQQNGATAGCGKSVQNRSSRHPPPERGTDRGFGRERGSEKP